MKIFTVYYKYSPFSSLEIGDSLNMNNHSDEICHVV